MNIQTVKIELMKMIIDTENPSILEKVLRVFQNEKQDFCTTLSLDEQNDILAGIQELERGEKYSYEETIQKHRK
jgi:hypothetical protein